MEGAGRADERSLEKGKRKEEAGGGTEVSLGKRKGERGGGERGGSDVRRGRGSKVRVGRSCGYKSIKIWLYEEQNSSIQ
ncbi:hypothetical protein VNO78_05323 [Psophocarpus tetragonolobus]|uniref:Uncharacterized protein n=1 Tax=Psophocarpus tetragonolobus TaxID=3891 RepID=A0AAN9SS25_PSOTE